MLVLYIFLEILLFPLIFIYILLNKKTRSSFFHRLGFFLPVEKKTILIHTVSVGEFLAAKRLIKKLIEKYENIYVSTVTLTGKEVVLKENLKHIFFPFDYPFVVEKFLNSLNPKIAIIFETELWPYFIYKCYKRKIPVIIVNGRISDNSFKKYKMFSFFFKGFFKKIDLIFAQTAEDGERFTKLGAKKVLVKGNLKFDFQIKELDLEVKEFYNKFTQGRIGWAAGSTLKGEEEIILNAHKKILKNHPNAFLILAPRHPERSEEVEKLILKSGLSCIKRSQFPKVSKEDVLLVDCVGELAFLYSYARIAFVGGSLVPKGGHNILEPAYFKVPIIIGPYYSNFKEIVNTFMAKKGLIILNANEFDLSELFEKDLSEIGLNAYKVLKENTGLIDEIFNTLKEYLK